MKTPLTVLLVSALLVNLARAQNFTGAELSDQNFSTTGNWDTGGLPVDEADVSISANATTELTPALINGEWTLGTVRVNSLNFGTGGFGMAYAEIKSGGILRSKILYIGSNSNAAYDGNLTVRNGGSLESDAQNSGVFSIGGASDGMVGVVLIEDGAAIEHSRIALEAYGEMTFEFGASSVSTFNALKDNSGRTNLLNGLLQVDLAALSTVGSYTLINSNNANLLLSGQLVDDLATSGGTITSAGESSSFNVLNAGNAVWNLTTADGGQDLIFNVTSIPEPSTYAWLTGFSSILLVFVRRNHC
ncbi:hypothetical protein ACWPKS_03090 [Coraliomargarita sp. W4R72]